MNEKDDIIKSYPFLGYSKNLIESFLIIGFETPFKNRISTQIVNNLNNHLTKNKNETLDNQNNKEPPKILSFKIRNKPVIINNISPDFKDAILKEEEIINYMYPNGYTKIYARNINDKNIKNEKSKLLNQNLFFYLSADKILEKTPTDAEQNIGNKKVDSHVMFNVHGYLFWESLNINNYIIFFPKIFTIISQYSYFKFFSYLSQILALRIKKFIKSEIPLEIQIYNIVRFIPSPINCALVLDLMPTEDLLFYKNIQKKYKIDFFKKESKGNNKYKKNLNLNQITLPRLTGCPYFDIDLSFLFRYFNFETFFTIYIFSFLEFKLFFFSPYLDFINSIMYIFRFFSFPFFDNNDLGQIYSISKEDFLYGDKEIENNLIGVNCEYDEKMVIPHYYKDYMIISYNQDLLNIYFNKDIIFSYPTNFSMKNNYNKIINNNIINSKNINNDILKLINYIRLAIKDEDENRKRERVLFLEKKLYEMYESLFICFRNIVNNDKENNINFSLKPCINELKMNDDNHRKFDFKYNEHKEQNEHILKAIYTFNFSIFKYFHSMVKLALPPQCTDTKDYKCLPYKLIIEKKKMGEEFGECDKIFLNYFEKTSKYNQMINLFLLKNECSEISRPYLIMAEEFINIKKANIEHVNDYIQLMNNFYNKNRAMAIINFNNFYAYYNDLQKTIYDISTETEKSRNYLVFKKKGYSFDNNILKKYAYILNNIEKEKLNKIFPILDFKLHLNQIPEVNTTIFADFLESYNFLNINRLTELTVVFLLLIIYIIVLSKKIIMFHFFEEILNIKIERKIPLRKYIYIILNLLSEIIKEKIKDEKNYIEELLLYKEIMNSIYKNNQSNESMCYYPNERLSTILENFSLYEKKYEELLTKHEDYIEMNKKIIEDYYSGPKDLLEEGVDYKVLICNNACRAKMADDKIFLGLYEMQDKPISEMACQCCQIKIRPYLLFIHDPTHKCEKVDIYIINDLYKKFWGIVKKMNINNLESQNELEKFMFIVIANLIYYINGRKNPESAHINHIYDNSNICDYLASCLK